MAMTFYYAPQSTSTRVHWALEELGVPYEKVRMNLYERLEHKTPAFLKLNPNGQVPVLVVDGVPIWESLAQLLHLGETYGVERGLFPEAGPKRAVAFMWLAWFGVSVHANAVRIFSNGEHAEPAQRNAHALAAAVRDTTAQVAILDEHLKTNAYVLGDAFSIVDCQMASSIAAAAHNGIDTTPFAAARAWAERCTSRPAFARAE